MKRKSPKGKLIVSFSSQSAFFRAESEVKVAELTEPTDRTERERQRRKRTNERHFRALFASRKAARWKANSLNERDSGIISSSSGRLLISPRLPSSFIPFHYVFCGSR